MEWFQGFGELFLRQVAVAHLGQSDSNDGFGEATVLIFAGTLTVCEVQALDSCRLAESGALPSVQRSLDYSVLKVFAGR